MKIGLGLCAAILLVAVRIPVGAGDKKKEGKDPAFDPAKLVGNWTYVSGEKGGEKIDEANLKKQKVKIDKKEFVLTGDDAVFHMDYEIDTKKTPATIRFKMTKSPFGEGMTAAGIIELKGDELRVAYTHEGEPATKFETKGTKAHSFVLKRAK